MHSTSHSSGDNYRFRHRAITQRVGRRATAGPPTMPAKITWNPGKYAVASSGHALTMAGNLLAHGPGKRAGDRDRAGRHAARRAARPSAEPSPRQRCCAGSANSPPTRRPPPADHDREHALLRLEPGAADSELWTAWGAGRLRQPADALRESQKRPVARQLRGGHRGTDRRAAARLPAVVHAPASRTTGRVPTAPACGCWQLLTALTDPLARSRGPVWAEPVPDPPLRRGRRRLDARCVPGNLR